MMKLNRRLILTGLKRKSLKAGEDFPPSFYPSVHKKLRERRAEKASIFQLVRSLCPRKTQVIIIHSYDVDPNIWDEINFLFNLNPRGWREFFIYTSSVVIELSEVSATLEFKLEVFSIRASQLLHDLGKGATINEQGHWHKLELSLLPKTPTPQEEFLS